jgi:hypothetical protein
MVYKLFAVFFRCHGSVQQNYYKTINLPHTATTIIALNEKS